MKYKKQITLLIIVIIGIVSIYHSVYFEKLDARKQKEMVKKFNPKEQVEYFWKNDSKGIFKTAIPISVFDSLLKVSPIQLFTKHGKTIGISYNRCFLISGTTEIKSVGEDKALLATKGNYTYKIITKNIFNSIARDATGYFNIDNFENTMDFNEISTEMNTTIMKNVVNKLSTIPVGNKFRFTGAVEINSESIPNEIEIVPLELNYDISDNQ